MRLRIIGLFLLGTALDLFPQSETFSDGDLNFEVTGEATCRLISSPNVCGTLTLPPEVIYDNVTYALTAVGPGALSGATGLEALFVPESVSEIGREAVLGCTALRVVELGRGVRSIGDEAFVGCAALESVALPDELISVPRRCFYGDASLRQVRLGASLGSIATQAFDACPALSSVVCMAQVPPATGAYSFDPTAVREAILTVPEGCRPAYSAESVWRGFRSIVESDYGGETAPFTVMFPDGAVTSEEALGSRLTLSLSVPNGWTLAALRFNDTDVTSEVSHIGYYTTPPILEESILSLVLREESGIQEADNNRLNLWRSRRGVVIRDLPAQNRVQVYSLDGRKIFDGRCDGLIPLDSLAPVVVVVAGHKYLL